MMNHYKDNDYLIFNPDTFWSENYINDINKMQNLYFRKKMNNILLLCKKELSYDKNLKGDFALKDNLLNKDLKKDFIYIGFQILNRYLFEKYELNNFSISEVWNDLLKMNLLNGFESSNKFYHLTNLEIFKKLKDF